MVLATPVAIGIGILVTASGSLLCMQTGTQAPDFSVVDENGVERTLADFAGKTLVLWFYPKADTPG